MPLESLSNDQINIHDLTLEQEKDPRPESQQAYELLKTTPFYEDEMWRNSELSYTANDQLLSILIEVRFDNPSALLHFNRLKSTPIYNRDNSMWSDELKFDKSLGDSRISSNNQFYGLLAEAFFDYDVAKQHFKQLKESPLFDSEKDIWEVCLTRKLEPFPFPMAPPNRLSASQELSRILAEYHFDDQLASFHYDNLRQTKLYNKDKDLWAVDIEHAYAFLIEEQFLGILVEAMRDKATAKHKFEELKKTDMYNDHQDFVNRILVSESIFEPRLKFLSPYLLEILCIQEFEEKSESNLQSSIPQLPETRSY